MACTTWYPGILFQPSRRRVSHAAEAATACLGAALRFVGALASWVACSGLVCRVDSTRRRTRGACSAVNGTRKHQAEGEGSSARAEREVFHSDGVAIASPGHVHLARKWLDTAQERVARPARTSSALSGFVERQSKTGGMREMWKGGGGKKGRDNLNVYTIM